MERFPSRGRIQLLLAVLLGCVMGGGVAFLVLNHRPAGGGGGATVRAHDGGVAGDPATASVEIPAGALAADANVSVQAQDPSNFRKDGVEVAGKVWRFRVDDRDHYQFQKNVTLRVPYDSALVRASQEPPQLRLAHWSDARWISVPGFTIDSVAHKAVAQVSHFSDYAVLRDTTMTANNSPADDVRFVASPVGEYKTEWVLIVSRYDSLIDNLARAVTNKYRKAVGLQQGRYVEPTEWLNTGSWVRQPRATSEIGGDGDIEKFEIKNTACLAAARAEFSSRKKALDEAYARALGNWVDAVRASDVNGLAALLQARADLLDFQKALADVPLSTRAWRWVVEKLEGKVQGYAEDQVKSTILNLANAILRLDDYKDNPLYPTLQKGLDQAYGKALSDNVSRHISELMGKPTQANPGQLADELLKMAVPLLLDLAYNQNHGKDGPFLNPQDDTYFQLTGPSIEALRELLPHVAAQVSPLKDRRFAKKNDFLDAVDAILTPDDADKYDLALSDLAFQQRNPTTLDSFYALSGTITRRLGRQVINLEIGTIDIPLVRYDKSYTMSISLLFFEEELLTQKVASMKWEVDGYTIPLGREDYEVFANGASHNKEVNAFVNGEPGKLIFSTGAPGQESGNLLALRQDYARFKLAIEAEGRRGRDAFFAVIKQASGPSATPADKVQALAAIRLLQADVKKFVDEDFTRQIKQLALGKLKDSLKAKLKAEIPLAGGLADAVADLLDKFVDWAAPDPIKGLSQQIDAAWERIARDLVGKPKIAPALPEGGVKPLLELNTDIPLSCGPAPVLIGGSPSEGPPATSVAPPPLIPTGPSQSRRDEARPSTEIEVPRVIGMSAKDAKASLASKGLRIRLEAGDAPPVEARAFTIQAQAPEPGARVQRDATIALRIHPAFEAALPVHPPSDIRLTVPSVVGFHARDAKTRLGNSGFSDVAFVAAADPPASADREFTVQQQDPSAGTKTQPGTTITLALYGKLPEPVAPTVPSAPAAREVAWVLVGNGPKRLDPRNDVGWVNAGAHQKVTVRHVYTPSAQEPLAAEMLRPGTLTHLHQLIETDDNSISADVRFDITFESDLPRILRPDGSRFPLTLKCRASGKLDGELTEELVLGVRGTGIDVTGPPRVPLGWRPNEAEKFIPSAQGTWNFSLAAAPPERVQLFLVAADHGVGIDTSVKGPFIEFEYERREIARDNPGDPGAGTLSGTWLLSGQWKWVISQNGANFKVEQTTDPAKMTVASVVFDGNEATITFSDTGYAGTITWSPAKKNGSAILVFSRKPDDSPQVIGQKNEVSMEKLP